MSLLDGQYSPEEKPHGILAMLALLVLGVLGVLFCMVIGAGLAAFTLWVFS